jgi:periplasmic copper chaperone A
VRTWQRIFASCCSVVALAGLAACGEKAPETTPTPPAGLSVRGAWARAADSGAMTAVYFTLANDGATSDTLMGVSSADAALTEMHISTQRDGMMHMSPVTALPVPAMDSVSFRPLGAHVMLTGVVRPLAEGDSVTTTLSFVSGATLTVRAGVRKP